jgi:uncharacterized membrane protein
MMEMTMPDTAAQDATAGETAQSRCDATLAVIGASNDNLFADDDGDWKMGGTGRDHFIYPVVRISRLPTLAQLVDPALAMSLDRHGQRQPTANDVNQVNSKVVD